MTHLEDPHHIFTHKRSEINNSFEGFNKYFRVKTPRAKTFRHSSDLSSFVMYDGVMAILVTEI